MTDFIYAAINSDNIVMGISQLSSETIQSDLILIPEYDLSLLGKTWNGEAFIETPDTNTYLKVIAPTNPITKTSSINIVATIENANADVLPVTATYYVPVIRKVDNFQAAFLVVDFVNGTANVSFSIAESGIYTISMNNISPRPTAILQENIELIVT